MSRVKAVVFRRVKVTRFTSDTSRTAVLRYVHTHRNPTAAFHGELENKTRKILSPGFRDDSSTLCVRLLCCTIYNRDAAGNW